MTADPVGRELTDAERERIAARRERRAEPKPFAGDLATLLAGHPDPQRARAEYEAGRAAAEARRNGQVPPEKVRETPAERDDRLARARAAVESLAARRRAEWDHRCPTRFAAAALADLSPEQDPDGRVSGYLDQPLPTLLLVGPAGTGKSHAAHAVGNAAWQRGLWPVAWNTADLMDALRRDVLTGDVLTALDDCDVLILDELGVERITSGAGEFVAEHVQRIVDMRYRNRRRLVITTNLTSEQMEARYGWRVADRLDEDSQVVNYRGLPSRRRRDW